MKSKTAAANTANFTQLYTHTTAHTHTDTPLQGQRASPAQTSAYSTYANKNYLHTDASTQNSSDPI